MSPLKQISSVKQTIKLPTGSLLNAASVVSYLTSFKLRRERTLIHLIGDYPGRENLMNTEDEPDNGTFESDLGIYLLVCLTCCNCINLMLNTWLM